MSANVESMFSVREVPWHGLGTIIEEAPDSREALMVAGLNWEVKPQPLYLEDGTLVAGSVANVRQSDGKVLGVVSDRYKIVQNEEAFSFTDALIGGDVRYETAGSLQGGRLVWMLARMPETKILGDAVDPYLCFSNTHDGSGAVRVCMTPIRVVCNNTLNAALYGASRKWSARHCSSIEKKMEEARNTLQLAGEYMVSLAAQCEDWACIKMTNGETEKVIESLFGKPKEDASQRVWENYNYSVSDFKTRYFADDNADYWGTAYGLINAAADFSAHSEPLRQTSTYAENRWQSLMGGNQMVDKVAELVAAL